MDDALTFSFRAAGATDATAVAKVARRTWRETYAGMIPEPAIEAHLASAYLDEQVATRIGRAERFDLAEDADGGVVGFAEWQLHDGVAELVATYVLPGCQRRGIGRAFHERALDAFRGRTDTFETCVLSDNAGGRKFYESIGYRPEGEATFPLAGAVIGEIRYRLAPYGRRP